MYSGPNRLTQIIHLPTSQSTETNLRSRKEKLTNKPSKLINTLSTTTSIADTSVSQPVSQAERIQTIDILRGMALLGILLMNIPGFAMPDKFADAFRSDPSTVNFWVNAFITIVFEGKMRALFSMIFGVGIILFMTRKEKGAQRTGPGQAVGCRAFLPAYGVARSIGAVRLARTALVWRHSLLLRGNRYAGLSVSED